MKRHLRLATVGITIAACVMLATTATSDNGARNLHLTANVVDVATPSDGGGGRAILQYRRGLQLEPGNRRIQANLHYALSRRMDQIEVKSTTRRSLAARLLFWHDDHGPVKYGSECKSHSCS